MIVSGMTYPYGSYMIVFKKVREQYVMAFLNITVKVICLTIFVPLYGTWGAVIGVLASSYSTIFAVYYYIYKFRREIRSKN
jgi:O-antigen/teichoic acid export membrane protein